MLAFSDCSELPVHEEYDLVQMELEHWKEDYLLEEHEARK
jgi:hypothetical protein